MRNDPTAASAAGSRMVYADFDPEPALARWIASFWTLAVAPGVGAVEHHVPPDGCTHLAVRSGQAVLVGPRVTPLTPPVAAGDRWLGIRFRPGTARCLLGVGSDLDLRERVIPVRELRQLAWAGDLARDVASAAGDLAGIALASDHLRRRATTATAPDEAVLTAIRLVLEADAAPPVRALARAVGLSERHLRRRFVAAVDLSPKELARIWRVRRCAVGLITDPAAAWSARAADHGFADQSHLVREFRRLIGLTPGELAQQTAAIEHRDLRFPAPVGPGRLPPSGNAGVDET